MLWFKSKEQKEAELKRKNAVAERQRILSQEKNKLIGYYYVINNTEYSNQMDYILTFCRHIGEDTKQIKEKKLNHIAFAYGISGPKEAYIQKLEKEGFVCEAFIEKKTIEFFEKLEC